MWDTAGQERFKALIPSYLKNAHSIILTFDIIAKSSFLSLTKWFQDIKEHIQDGTFIIVAGNKINKDKTIVLDPHPGKEEGAPKKKCCGYKL